MELFTSVRQKSKTQSDNKINLDKACVHDNYLGNLIVFFLIAKENQFIVLLLSKIIIMGNMYWTAPNHSGTAGP